METMRPFLLFVTLCFFTCTSLWAESQRPLSRPIVSLGVHIGFQWNSLKQRPQFADYSADYQNYREKLDSIRVDAHNSSQTNGIVDTAKANSLRSLQAFQPVDITFPIGLSVHIRTFAFADLVLSTQSFWHEQVEILEYQDLSFHNGSDITVGSIESVPLKYGVQAHLAGVGVRLHLPTDFISITGSKPIVIQVQRLWHLWNSEIYTSHGVLQARSRRLGSGLEIAAGYPLRKFGPVQVTAYLSYFSASFQSSHSWEKIMPFSLERPYISEQSWDINALKFQFQFNYLP